LLEKLLELPDRPTRELPERTWGCHTELIAQPTHYLAL